MTDSTKPTISLTLPRVKGRVEIVGALGLLPRVHYEGERVRTARGGFLIPTTSGEPEPLRQKGLIPGFQRYLWKGEEVARLGAHVKLPERITMWFPLALVLFAWPGVVMAIPLLLVSVLVVKNPQMPRGLRIALPIVNTFAGGALLTSLAIAVQAG